MSIFVEDLLSSAKLRTLAPISQNTFQESDLVLLGNEELALKLVSDLFTAREDFFLTTKTIPLIAELAYYGIPARAIANGLQLVTFVSSSGNKRKLERIDSEQALKYAERDSEPAAFMLEGDEIVLVPTPSAASGSLEVKYYAKPNRLKLTSECAKITAVSSDGLGTTTLTVDTDISSANPVASKLDFVSATSPFLLWAEQVTIAAISTTQIQVATASISNAAGTVEPQVGDYICPTGYTNIPMIPVELHPVLAQMMAVRILAALGHIEKWNAAKLELKEVREEAMKLVKNRVETSPKRVVGRNNLLSAFSGN